MKSIPQLGLKYGQVNLKAILIYLVILSTGLVTGFANGGSRSQSPAGAVPNAENLKPVHEPLPHNSDSSNSSDGKETELQP